MASTFKLKNGSILLSTEAPGGIYNSSQLKKIAMLCDQESIIVKATEDQRLALFVNPEKAPKIAQELKSIGLGIRHYQDGLHQPVSCIGELCEDHEQDALGTALDVSAEIETIKLESPLKIGINGCAKCCVPCHTLDVSVVGDSQGYRISLGGKNSALPEMASFMAEGVPPNEMPRLIKALIEIYKSDAQPGESLQELIEREGAAKFVAALAPWSQDAADTSDPFAKNDSISSSETESIEPSSIDSTSDELRPLSENGNDISGDVSDAEVQIDEMALIDEENVVQHSELSGIESSEISLNESSTDENEFENINDLNLTASHHHDTSDTLDEITVNSASDINDLNVPIDLTENHGPEISLQEVELADSDDPISSDISETSSESQTNEIDSQEQSAEEFAEPVILSNESMSLDTQDAEKSSNLLESTSSSENDLDFMSEAAIDAGDVLHPIKPSQEPHKIETTTSPVSKETEEVKTETEQTAEEEDLVEAKLNASIEAQQEILGDDTSDKEREESMDLLDHTDITLDETEDLNESSNEDETETSFEAEDLESLEPEMIAPEDEKASDSDSEMTGVDDFDDHEFDVHDHLPLSEVVATRKITPSKTSSQPSKTWSIAGFDLDDDGSPVISWTNGVTITVTQEAIAMGRIKIGGHELKITQKNAGLQVEVDGMKLFLPLAA